MDKQTRNVLIAGVGGLAVGAALGILFAPDEGKKTRAKIKKKTNDFLDKASEKLESTEDLFCDLKEKLESSFSEEKSEAKEELIQKIQELEQALKKK